jgi:diaminohydroxyphosphoribosylaminopyrimidine deaminase/5-amino-6-(5-phosphoribosylamino)uracil reductase
MVGAVVVKDGRVIGEGFHKKFGREHAEVYAIESAVEPVVGATLYCNLEPCCHWNKKTPPCAQRIIKEKIKRVVIANLDPNPEVDGKGVKLLRQAGIEVKHGVLKQEGDTLNRFFFKFITTKLPYVNLKLAQTVDGKITKKIGTQTQISSSASQELLHKWRSEYDAVLVGANTVKIDNPQLTVRQLTGRNPLRVIIDGRLTLRPIYRIFQSDASNQTFIITAQDLKSKQVELFDNLNCRLFRLPAHSDGRIVIKNILTMLAKKNIASLLVEGGQQIFSEFIREELVDEINLFLAPEIWGIGLSAFKTLDLDSQNNFKLAHHKRCGGDVLLTYRKMNEYHKFTEST